ncbi:MAG TPA: nucleotidyltransferase domain-containing protein [Arachnia sp.]|nr:nucleotidyltransferase domain-containing protein [Arachnia sp.]HMT87343.1 nucleotidyltransferase domain-containing protein [Arachnia sp.]
MTSAAAAGRHPVSVDGLRHVASAIREVVRRNKGTGEVLVFGSVARGEAGPDSDIDLLVEFLPGASLFDLVAVELELEELLGRSVDVMSVNSVGRAADHARAQAVSLP